MLSQIKTLDGLKGYAALFVLLSHFPQVTHSIIGFYFKKAISISYIGYISMDLFFAISGFVITRILIQNKLTNSISYKEFYLNRILRVFPIYYLSIILCGFLFSWNKMEYIATFIANYWFAFDLDLHPLKHVWSLSVEMHFYLLWPLLIYAVNLNKSRKIIQYLIPFVAISTAILASFYFDQKIYSRLIYRGTNFHIITLAFGAVLAYYENRISDLPLKKLALITSIILINMVILLLFKTPVIKLVTLSLISSLIVILVININYLKTTNRINKLFTNKMISYISKISYGIYLYHFPILYYFGIAPGMAEYTTLPTAILALICIIIIPVISFHLLENPILKMRKKLIQ